MLEDGINIPKLEKDPRERSGWMEKGTEGQDCLRPKGQLSWAWI